jgi:hypothetical protein
MAGAGWRTFTIGQLLTSAQVQTFLQDQSVQVHASAAARSSALGTAVSIGMVSYRADGRALELYAGATWTPLMQGENRVINGAFDFWQRGTTFAHTNVNVYGADRWGCYRSGYATGATTSRQLAGSTLPQFQYATRVQRDSGNTSTAGIVYTNAFETRESLPLAGQTVTLSFYARAGANFSSSVANALAVNIVSGTGTDQTMWGGFSGYTNVIASDANLTTSWQRFFYTGTVGSTATQVAVMLAYTPSGTAGANDWFEVTGVQVETGSVATPFVRAGGTLQGELAACQRYYYRVTAGSLFGYCAVGNAYTTTNARVSMLPPVNMRVTPTAVDFSGVTLQDGIGGNFAPTSVTIPGNVSNSQTCIIEVQVASGLTAFRPMALGGNNNGAHFIGISAEL